MRRNDPLPQDENKIRKIFLISYAATPKGLTRMSHNATVLAARLAARYRKATIFFCVFRDNPPGAMEAAWKIELLPIERVHGVGVATSTTDEEEILAAAAENDVDESVVVGGGLHIRRAAIAWEHKHPNERLYFQCTDGLGDDDPDNPMKAQRNWQVWEVANLVGLLFYKIIGVEYFAKKNLSQPVD